MPKRQRKKHKISNWGVADPILDRHPVAVLDLHHYAASEVDGATSNFILTWQKRSPGAVVHIVTGKGRRSAGAPVLKPRVRQLLQTQLQTAISDWTKDIDDGGFLVLLR